MCSYNPPIWLTCRSCGGLVPKNLLIIADLSHQNAQQLFDGLPLLHAGPEGVRGRNSDNQLILQQLGWEPTIRLADGLRLTYNWIKDQLHEEGGDSSLYSSSNVVKTSAPRELGSVGPDKAAVNAAREGFEAAAPASSNGNVAEVKA